MGTPLERFQDLLRELFQFKHVDLDFGIYRIMNVRRKRMEKWLTIDLPARVRELIEEATPTFDDQLATRLLMLREELNALQPGAIDADGKLVNDVIRQLDKGKEYERLFSEQQKAPGQSTAEIDVQVYNHLHAGALHAAWGRPERRCRIQKWQ